MAYLKIWQRKKKKITVAGNREYKEIDSLNSAQSSMKSHLLWVTVYPSLGCIYYSGGDQRKRGCEPLRHSVCSILAPYFSPTKYL